MLTAAVVAQVQCYIRRAALLLEAITFSSKIERTMNRTYIPFRIFEIGLLLCLNYNSENDTNTFLHALNQMRNTQYEVPWDYESTRCNKDMLYYIY